MILKFLYRAWRFQNRVEKDEISWVRENVFPGQTVVDIGANKGAFTYWMQKGVGPKGKVIAFEPQPELVEYLNGVKEEMEWENVDVVGAALSDECGEKTLFRPDDCACLGASLALGVHVGGCKLTVPTVTLDDYLTRTDNRPVSFIKCDVEGHELPVFRGAESVLREDRPTIMFDCEAQHYFWHTAEDVLQFLYDLGYEGGYFANGELHDATKFDSSVHQRKNAKPYVYSFLFSHAKSRELAKTA